MIIVNFIFDIIGVIAFAVSGTLVAMKHKMDIIGAIILANVTSFGGGVTRDLLIGCTPKLLTDPIYFLYAGIATGTSILLMILTVTVKPFASRTQSKPFNYTLNIMDAIGLAPFCIVGVNIGIENGYDGIFLLCVIGCISGCGGGILRDVFAHRIPIIFRKYIYLLPCLLGVLSYVLLLPVNTVLAYVVGITLIVGGRLIGIFFKVNMPVIKLTNDEEE